MVTNPELPGSRLMDFQVFLDKLRRSKGLTYKDLASRIWGRLDSEQMQKAEKRLEHFFRDANVPKASMAKAVERALEVNLDPEDYGFDAEELSGSL